MLLDPDEVLETDHTNAMAGNLQDLGAGQQIIVCSDGLQIREQVERILAVNIEREVRAERQRLGIEAELQVGRSASEGQFQRLQNASESLEIFGRPAVAKVNVIGDASTAHQSFRLAADHHELDAGVGQERAEPLKRTGSGRL